MKGRISLSDLILHEDDDLWVINKPPMIASLHDRSGASDIQSLIRKEDPSAQVCHRLDKETSGCLIVAKNPETYRYLSVLFEDRLVKKLYLAIVEGNRRFDEEIVDLPIFTRRNGESVIDQKMGKDSATIINTVKFYKGYSLVQAMPITGRQHQIRVHLAAFNSPIAGDHKYGGHAVFLSSIKRHYSKGKGAVERPLIDRTALHSFKVSFPLQNGGEITVEAPYPKDFSVLLRQLEKYSN